MIDGNKQRIQQRQRRELAQSIKFAEARLSASLSAAFNYVAGAVCVGHRRPVFSRMAPPLHAVLDSTLTFPRGDQKLFYLTTT